MTVSEWVQRARSTRRFRENDPVGRDALERLVDLARLAASGGNKQPLKYLLSYARETNQSIFDLLTWAAYLKGWKGPEPGERPAAYIVVLGDHALASSFGCDHGIASQSILLGAAEAGLGACIVGTVDRDRLRRRFQIPERYSVLHVIALGKPAETVMLETVKEDGNIRYWRDDRGVHHVPKRRLEDVILNPPFPP